MKDDCKINVSDVRIIKNSEHQKTLQLKSTEIPYNLLAGQNTVI